MQAEHREDVKKLRDQMNEEHKAELLAKDEEIKNLTRQHPAIDKDDGLVRNSPAAFEFICQ